MDKSRIRSLDGLRAISIGLVVLGHVGIAWRGRVCFWHGQSFGFAHDDRRDADLGGRFLGATSFGECRSGSGLRRCLPVLIAGWRCLALLAGVSFGAVIGAAALVRLGTVASSDGVGRDSQQGECLRC